MKQKASIYKKSNKSAESQCSFNEKCISFILLLLVLITGATIGGIKGYNQIEPTGFDENEIRIIERSAEKGIDGIEKLRDDNFYIHFCNTRKEIYAFARNIEKGYIIFDVSNEQIKTIYKDSSIFQKLYAIFYGVMGAGISFFIVDVIIRVVDWFVRRI